MSIQEISIIAAAAAVSFGAIGPALAEGRAVSGAMDAIARQPDNGRHRCREELSALLGRATEVGFADDPRLIAGVEIHFPNTILRHSWREALSGALQEMTRDGDAHRGA